MRSNRGNGVNDGIGSGAGFEPATSGLKGQRDSKYMVHRNNEYLERWRL